MKQRQLPLPGPIVRKSNALARASWSVKSVYEPRLVALVAARVKSTDEDFQEYAIPASELLTATNDGGHTMKIIANVVDELMGRTITMPRPDGKEGFVKYTIFSKVAYDATDKIITTSFHPDLRIHFLNLLERFTQYGLVEFLKLRSVYSQRLYEVLKSWSDKPEVTYQLDELFDMLSVPTSLQRYPDFRRKVLEKAHIDIHKYTKLKFAFEPILNKRTVVSIRFALSPTRIKELQLKFDESIKKKTKDKNDSLMRCAIACNESNPNSCTPKKNEQCKICLRLVRNKPQEIL